MNRILNLMLRYVLYFSPAFIRKKVSEKHSRQEMQHWMEISKRTKINKDEIEAAINALDIDGKDVLLHTSMAKIGKMQGGPKWFCECLFKKIDMNNQTLLVSALPFRGRFKDYLNNLRKFDVRTAPIAMGAINERIALMPEANRSVHPTHSVVAVGKDAVFYTNEHHLDETPFDVHSPYYKLFKNRGKVVLFGADLDNFTLVHVCEDLLGSDYPLKVYDKTIFEVPCVDAEGNELVVRTKCHNPILGIKRDLKPFESVLTEQGIMQSVPIGESKVSVVDAHEFVICYLNEMKEGNTMYGRIKVNSKLRQRIDEIIGDL